MASLWLTEPGADDDGGGEGVGGGTLGNCHCVEGEVVEADDWSIEKGRDRAPDRQMMILRRHDYVRSMEGSCYVLKLVVAVNKIKYTIFLV